METNEKTLGEMPVGARLLIQCKKDWRTAVVSAVFEENIIIQVCSPSGRTYRRKFAAATILQFAGELPILGEEILWREQYAKYDYRW